MQFLVEIAVCTAVCVLWNLLMIVGLRLSGIRVPLRFGKQRGIGTQTSLLSLGKWGYVFVKGVLLFGWGLFAGITASEYASQRYFSPAHNRLTLVSTTLALLIFSACGVFFGVYEWNSSAHPEAR
jgi:hypothetical protein